ncbi:NC domain-containing protein [Leptolyngbya sp. FACHB-1515]
MGIARHYYLSKDGDFDNSVGWTYTGVEWRGEIDLTQEQRDRIGHYAEKFGAYSILSNNCEMFAWYVLTGKHYSGQTQEVFVAQVGAALISLVQPVCTVRSQKYLQVEQAISHHLEKNLAEARKHKLLEDQAARDAFWAARHAART